MSPIPAQLDAFEQRTRVSYRILRFDRDAVNNGRIQRFAKFVPRLYHTKLLSTRSPILQPNVLPQEFPPSATTAYFSVVLYVSFGINLQLTLRTENGQTPQHAQQKMLNE